MNFSDKIIDRDTETSFLFEDITNNKMFTINILYSPTAIGKSSITLKLSRMLFNNNVEMIRVKTNPINKANLCEWTFVNRIFEELEKVYLAQEYSFDAFINNHNYFLNLRSKIDIDFLKDLNINNIIFKPFLLGQKNDFDNVSDLLIENDKLFLYAKQEYINYILANRNIVMIIDNFQNIDDSSLEFLKRCFLFNSIQNHYVIFEYTLEKNKLEKILKVSEYFISDNIAVKCTPISKTNSLFIADIIDLKVEKKPPDFKFNLDLINHYIELDTGNIRELIDFSINYKSTNVECNNKTLESILNLSDIELFVLFVLFEFDGYIKEKYLKQLVIYSKISSYENSLELLIQKQLLHKNNDTIIIEHASIMDALKNNNKKLIAIKHSTINIIKSYVENLLRNNESIYPYLTVLLNIYKHQSPIEISKLFKYIEESILLNLQPKDAWEYFCAFINVTIDSVNDYIPLYISIFKMCFKFELYNEVFPYLESVYPYFDLTLHPSIIIYRMLFLAALDKHKENILYYNSIKSLLINNERLYLNANLAVLSSLRSLGDYNTCLSIHKVLKNRKYKKYIEYGYQSRLVDMYLSRKKAIKYLKRSICHFIENGQAEQLAKTLITYTHILGGLGKVDEANKQITRAAALLNGRILGNHMILVNKAVIKLIGNNFNGEVYRLLDMAEASAIVPFDKLAIIVNKLVWCYENERFDLVHTMEVKSQELLNLEPDMHIHSLLYYNLYINFLKEGIKDKADKYLQKAMNTMKYCEPVKSRLLNHPTKETEFILSKPWHVCYLAYWTFDVLIDDTTSS